MQRLEENLLGIDTRATGVIVRARHQGADAAINVGGDWYDALDIGDGRVAVAVGDVVGRGLDATTTAVRLRGALGLAAFDIRGPTEALTVLDRYAQTLRGAPGTTVALAVVDPNRAVVSYACAGHPPPCWCHRPVTWPTWRRAAPGRSASTYKRPEPKRGRPSSRRDRCYCSTPTGSSSAGASRSTPASAGRRKSSQTTGTCRCGASSRRSSPTSSAMAPRTTSLWWRCAVSAPARTCSCDAFSAGRDQQTWARQRLRVWLDSVGITGEDRDAVVLAVGEAVSNAIDHGSDRDPSQIVTVELARRQSKIIASVGDRGHWQPGLKALLAGRGRGHLIMEALSDDVDINLDQGGTVVTL